MTADTTAELRAKRDQIGDADLETLALAEPAVQPYVQGKTVKKIVVAKGRLVSIVVG